MSWKLIVIAKDLSWGAAPTLARRRAAPKAGANPKHWNRTALWRRVTLASINREAYIYFGAGATVAWRMAMPGVGRGVSAFDKWWDAQMARLSVDRQVRDYMHAVLDGGHAHWYLRPAMPLQRFVTRGLLPPPLREM